MRSWFLLLVCTAPLFAETLQQPELETGRVEKAPVFAKKMMVASANPFASEAGLTVLKEGGTALDAAIAIQMVLNVVEPQSSGIGGGALLLYFNKKENKVYAYDGREVAPREIDEKLFLDKKGKPLERGEAIIGGKAVGVPGLVRMLALAHEEQGKLPWASLFRPAIKLAEDGFPISERLYQLMTSTPNLKPFTNKKEGEIFENPELASTLRKIADEGPDAFYTGKIAKDIVRKVQSSRNPGTLDLSDLESYKALVREPLTTHYRRWKVVGFPPPGGGVVVAQMLGMLEPKDLTKYSLDSPEFVNLFCQASRLAFADRNYYVADPDYFPVPLKRLTNKKYLAKRGRKISAHKALGLVRPGEYPGMTAKCCPPMLMATDHSLPSTSQVCVVDGEGNAVSMTTSIENAFGSSLRVDGFFLNNELTDFSFVSKKDGVSVANRVEEGKRPQSAMSPTFVFDAKSGELVLAIGSAGGRAIVDYVAQATLGVLDFGLNVQRSIDFPHYVATDKVIELEEDTFIEKLAPELEEMGNRVEVRPLTSGTQGIQVTPEGLIGGADPRREGVALGF